jgi:hypothetical protein
MKKLIQIFKPGTHTAMSGVALNFTEADLIASAAAYDPALHEAPIVVGHPKADAPAYGWVKSLAYADGLQADPHQVDAAFAELVQQGRFKKVSASFYTPDAPSNPAPGVYYLRHVGFLGAQPPAVKGLKQAEFADNESGTIEFSEWDDVTNASLWRNLREFFIGKFGVDEADKTIPNYSVQQLEQAAQDELKESQADSPDPAVPSFQESTINPGDLMSLEDKARLAALETENQALKDQQAAFAEAELARKTESLHATNLAFAEGLIKAGTLLPAQKEVAVAALDFLAGQGQVVEFSEGDVKKPLFDSVKQLLEKLPKQIEFSELGNGDSDVAIDFADPGALANAATRYQSAQAILGVVIDDIAAIQHVRGSHV